jgi:hypothetical protein
MGSLAGYAALGRVKEIGGAKLKGKLPGQQSAVRRQAAVLHGTSVMNRDNALVKAGG